MNDCIFCKIASKEIPSKFIYENSEFICIPDIQPQSETHWLVIPKMHVSSLLDASQELLGKLFGFVSEISKQSKISEQGFRTVVNTGRGGGQTVFHLHAHLLAGKEIAHRHL